MQKKKLLIVQPALASYRIPVFNQVYRALNDFDFSVIAAEKDHCQVVSSAKGVEFPYLITDKSKMAFGLIWQPKIFFRILSLSKNDTLILTGNPRYIFNVIAALIAKIRGVHVIWWGQLWSLNTSKASLKCKIFIMRLVSNSKLMYTSREAKLLYRLTKDKNIHYLNNGIKNEEIRRLASSYNAYQRPQKIFFLGRLTPKANFPELLNALSELEKFHLEVVGGNPDAEMQQFIKSQGLMERITFYGEILDEEVIASIANQCLLFVYPGSVGLSLIHAFNYGLPAIVHDERRKHMPEIAAFKKGVNGETFERGEHQNMASVIVELSKNPDKLNHLSRNAFLVSQSDFNHSAMSKRFVKVIESRLIN